MNQNQDTNTEAGVDCRASACSPLRIMKDIENELDRLAEKLPEGYEVQICVENGAAWLQVVTPSGKTVPIDGDCETCWAMLMSDALGFCLTDFEENANGDSQMTEPDCPKCGNNRQVWNNKITRNKTCHRVGCYTEIDSPNDPGHRPAE